MDTLTITHTELALWSRYIQEICGIYLDASKDYILETRLRGLVRETGAGSLTGLYYMVKADITNGLRGRIIDAITTRETSFFRDTTAFELLRHKLLPEIIDRRRNMGMKLVPIRIWSAACSTGQEVYSMGIVIKELLGDLADYDIRILGTDISNRAIAQASYGYFSRHDLDRGLPADKLGRYFVQVGDQWQIQEDIRAMATFKTINLLEPFVFPAPFDIIFCRNVAIYFTEQDRARLFRKIGKSLARDGSLIIGAAESLTGLCPELEPKRYRQTVFYQLKGVSRSYKWKT